MEEHFNKLTPAELERLALIAEEMSEAIKVIGKIFRHGYNSMPPTTCKTNRDLLEMELGHVLNAVQMSIDANDLHEGQIKLSARNKKENIRKYLHHQKES